jgi:hypothetical protein
VPSPSGLQWAGHGQHFDAGDRTLLAIRPPLYDSPTTRGLYDATTGVYWASDAYATPVLAGTEFVEELDPAFWAEGFATFQTWNCPWVSPVDAGRFRDECRVVESLAPTVVATAHDPTSAGPHVSTALEMMRALPETSGPPQPGQAVLDEIVSSISPSVRVGTSPGGLLTS